MVKRNGIESTPEHYAFGYRRVSSLKQSYERQTKALHDIGIPDDRIYEDKVSGKFKSRPGLDALLKVARRGDTITVSSLDRLGRTVLHILQTIEELEHRGISVHSLKPGEQFEGVTGKLVRNIMASIAEWERENINERAAEARAAREAKGLTTGRSKSVLIPTKIDAVRTLRASGKTIAYIVTNQAMSRASVYRALAETNGSGDEP
ncbi:MAG: recombinase family protein [Cryobacterium sp.]|nr:recombinase family protein [Cryobacterium sp.]